jgi:hypothetical protein
MPSQNNLLGSGLPYVEEEVRRPGITRVPIWLYHETEAPAGVIVRDEEKRDKLERAGWVTSPALFNKTPGIVPSQILSANLPEPTNVPDDSPMEEVIDAQDKDEVPGAEDMNTSVVEEEVVDDLPPDVYACPTCGKEFGLSRTLKQHITAAHSKKKR